VTSPVIIELALNGPTSRSRNRHVPRTPEEIAEVALEGIDLGASIVHNHNDEPMFTLDAVHAVEPYVAAWEPVLPATPTCCSTRRWARAPGGSRCNGGGRTSRSWPGAGWAA
jgi:uncharacterized protein (DUF849 family)